jgi:hypothetical protein
VWIEIIDMPIDAAMIAGIFSLPPHQKLMPGQHTKPRKDRRTVVVPASWPAMTDRYH